MIKYSFIIPVKAINDYIGESIPNILKIERNDFEIIIYPDIVNSEAWEKTRQIATGNVGPAEKRTLAIRDAVGEILIFIDDDAYPERDFIDILEKDLEDDNVIAVGGPAITPSDDGFWQKVSGAVFLSALSGGNPERYIGKGKKRFVDDWPSVNLSVRKKDFELVRGFDCEYWPGEDTKLCLDLINSGGKIVYDPELIVYHHRRAGFFKHLKQIGGYGLHRGFFAKKYPKTSRKLKYFIPSFFLLFVLAGAILNFYNKIFLELYLAGWALYFLAILKAFFEINKYESFLVSIFCLPYIFFTHLVYGFRFIQGFVFTIKLKSKLRK
jgi:glycosyltransferase involved in cell wall biosynthesis